MGDRTKGAEAPEAGWSAEATESAERAETGEPARGPYQRVTAAMVAARAGVSPATVSLVANGKTAGRVSAQIILRVEEAIGELNYVVDKVASSLSRGSSSFVILVAPDIANPYFGKVITGVKDALGPGYQLLLSVSDVGQVPQAADVRALFAFRPAGLLVDAPNAQFLQDLAIEAPTVLLDAPDITGVPSVDMDVAAGAWALAEHLAARGHRTVAYLDSITATATFALRREAFFDRAHQLGMRPAPGPAVRSLIDLEESAVSFDRAWAGWHADGVTAIVCATDTHAYGVLHAARGLGLAVPTDLAVAGFDNLPYSQVSQPSLTSVELPGRELGHAAAAHLRALMEGREPDDATPLLRSRLVVRESTGS